MTRAQRHSRSGPGVVFRGPGCQDMLRAFRTHVTSPVKSVSRGLAGLSLQRAQSPPGVSVVVAGRRGSPSGSSMAWTRRRPCAP